MLEATVYYWAELEYSGHVYPHVSPSGHTLKGKKPDKDEIRIRLGLSALMGFYAQKRAPKVGPKAAHLRGYINRGGAPKNPNTSYYPRV